MARFQLPSIVSLFSRAITPAPSFDVSKYLATAAIESPKNTITDNYIPYLEIRRIFFIHRDKNAVCPIRGHWGEALIETETNSETVISFQDIKGCMSSKSGLTDFEQMRHHPKSFANVNFHIESYADRVDELAEKVLNGNGDCAVYKGQPAHIVQQEWDNEMWLANDGGSHRSAAIWHLDREQGRERLLNAHVNIKALSPDFREQCKTHSIWLFQLPSEPHKNGICSQFKQSGVQLSRQNDGFISNDLPDFCLIVKKSDPRHAEIAMEMKNAFYFSKWVQSAYAPLVKPMPSIAPECTSSPK